MNLNEELSIIKNSFKSIPAKYSTQLLRVSRMWQDQFARNIYKQELKDGNVIFPKLDFKKLQKIKIIPNEIWADNLVPVIIYEWEEEIPRYDFQNIGEYLLFMRSILNLEFDNAMSVVYKLTSKAEQITIYNSEQSRNEWGKLEKYFIFKGKRGRDFFKQKRDSTFSSD